MSTYCWVPGSRFAGDPTPVAEALSRLRRQTVDDIVAAAREATSPLHGYVFDVPPEEAAMEHYRDRARMLQRSILILPRADAQPEEGVRAFFTVRPIQDDADEGAEPPKILVSMADVAGTPPWKAQVIARLIQTLVGAEKSLAQLGFESDSTLRRRVSETVKTARREMKRLAA